ncbi:alpha/beta hydrolase [Salinirubrum litoreum]|uniref:Alpha/beta hydrolase n=1 Tax=Salinirubrum litoreum TaxID=1126234 RepID=A0ABD5R7D8_9EURY
MSETVLIPGGRDVRGSLDTASVSDTAESVVVACPPHPQHRGHRGDERLVAVSEALTAAGVDCLRFDYGDWDEGRGESADTRQALRWADSRYDRVGLFGFSFGASLALLAAGGSEVAVGLSAVSALAPTARLGPELDVVRALDGVDCPAQVVVGERDTTVDWEPVAERAREVGFEVRELSGDHFFVGQSGTVGEVVSGFLLDYV